MKINFKTCTEEQLWKYVASHLAKNGIDTILVGGAVAAIYSHGLYRSGDLDFVYESLTVQGIEKCMREIGFKKIDTRRFKHPECKHILVEFVGGPPVGIGEDYDIKPKKIKVNKATIKIYSPTDCVKDRLASYLYFKHEESLNQAVMVARAQKVSYGRIKKWCTTEKATWVYDAFLQKLKDSKL